MISNVKDSGTPNLFLHIGMMKTGTSAIKDSLQQNKYCLKEKGIFYSQQPAVEFAMSLYCENAYPEYKSSYTMPTEAAVETIINLFEKSKCKNLLILQERLSTLTNRKVNSKEKEIPQLIKAMFEGFNVIVIYYVRRQDLLMESIYSNLCFREVYKSSHMSKEYDLFAFGTPIGDDSLARLLKEELYQKEDMTGFERFCLRNHMYFRQDLIISKWVEVFGKENIIVRPYEREQMQKGLLYDFYKNALGFTDEEIIKFERVGDSNISVSRDALEFKIATGIDDGVPFSCVDRLLDNPSRCNSYFKNEERKRYMTFFEETNEFIAREYLGRGDGRLFYEKVEGHEEYNGLSIERARELQRKIIPVIKGCSGVTADRNPLYAEGGSMKEIIQSVRRAYFESVNDEYIKVKLDGLFHLLKKTGKDIVVYGVIGKLAECALEIADEYKKCVRIYVSDQIIQDKLKYKGYYVTSLKAIKRLNPDVVLIAAKESGKAIKQEIDDLNLSRTKIYPAYDFSDKIWGDFLSGLHLSGGE